jgi:hypothetical protein
MTRSAALWCAVAAAALAAANHIGHGMGLRYASASGQASGLDWLALPAWIATLGVAALASWRLFKEGAYALVLPLAALGLGLVEPGRAGDPRTWRLEWGVFGLAWTGIAVLLFRRLVMRLDELERRVHLEGAALALGAATLGAAAYALFEPRLPALRAQWVASALLLLWWLGWLRATVRYR